MATLAADDLATPALLCKDGAGLSANLRGVARNLSDGHLLTGGWDDATGEDLIEQIAAVGDYQVALEDLSR